MHEFSPAREYLLTPFVRYRIASDRWNDVDKRSLVYFDRFCTERYPYYNGISQEMIDGWCRKRETELNISCIRRTNTIVALIRYLQDRGLANLQPPTIPVGEKRTYIPHAFTVEELEKFFRECDRRAMGVQKSNRAEKALIAAVVFRLLYSSGLRTVEARLLRTENVDLAHGVVDIKYSKGHDQHYVVLHDSMAVILRQYDAAIRRIYPEREYFFPGDSTQPLYQEWMPLTFRRIWDSVNGSHAVPYDLRHNYATTNINRWVDKGFDFHDKLTYLSKSMGHKTSEGTRYYYSMVPALSAVLEDKTAAGFNEIVPEVICDE